MNIYLDKNFRKIYISQDYKYTTKYWSAIGNLRLSEEQFYVFVIKAFTWIEEGFVIPDFYKDQKIHIEYTNFKGDIYICENLERIENSTFEKLDLTK